MPGDQGLGDPAPGDRAASHGTAPDTGVTKGETQLCVRPAAATRASPCGRMQCSLPARRHGVGTAKVSLVSCVLIDRTKYLGCLGQKCGQPCNIRVISPTDGHVAPRKAIYIGSAELAIRWLWNRHIGRLPVATTDRPLPAARGAALTGYQPVRAGQSKCATEIHAGDKCALQHDTRRTDTGHRNWRKSAGAACNKQGNGTKPDPAYSNQHYFFRHVMIPNCSS